MLTMTMIGASRDAWAYLLSSVDSEQGIDRTGSKAAYYLAGGTPPGQWIGAGASELKLTGEVDEQKLNLLFGEGKNPVTGDLLGRAFHHATPVADRVAKRLAKEVTQMPNGLDVEQQEEWVAGLEEKLWEEELAKPEKQSVSGFEFVFSPPKSVSSLWAVADPELKAKIRDAHHAAIKATVHKLETDIVRTRTGTDGVAQENITGLIGTMFDHWDSREGDPQLHTHMLVANRVKGRDGKWRTIDSRWSLTPAVATAGAYYDSMLMDQLSNTLGVMWTTQEVLEHPEKYEQYLDDEQLADSETARHNFALAMGAKPGSVKWQIDAVPHELNKEFSTRSNKLNVYKDQLIAEYVEKHGKQPPAYLVIKFRQQATLATRKAKTVLILRELTRGWRERAKQYVGDTFMYADRVKAKGHERLKDLPLWTFRADDVTSREIEHAAATVLNHLAGSRSTFTSRNVETETLRHIMSWRFRDPEDRDQVVKTIVDAALENAIRLTPETGRTVTKRYRLDNGEDAFQPAARALYTTTQVWEAEERLLNAGRDTSGNKISEHIINELISVPVKPGSPVLSADQAGAVKNIAASGRCVDVLVGPAGAGKTTSLQKLKQMWELEHGAGSVIGLAPTAKAAEVLAESLDIETENTAKWLHETRNGFTASNEFNYTLDSNSLLIIDEASIAGTMALDTIRQQAETAGAKVLLVGDWAQLSAIDSGGAFGLLATDREDVAELDMLHRFSQDWEKEASKLLRLGKLQAVDMYAEQDRISWGLTETVTEKAVAAWKQDEQAGLESLLIGSTNETVTKLNLVAQTWRIEAGLVDGENMTLISEGTAGVGDRIVTRRNNRKLLTNCDRWVRNNDEWVIKEITDAGDIVAAAGEETVLLPAAYCKESVQLGYATTAHRAQGRTVQTAHTIVDSIQNRETFYVSMTRGKKANHAYVVVDEDQRMGETGAKTLTRTWRQTLEAVLSSRGGDLSAHDTIKEEADRVGSIKQLAAEYATLIAADLEHEYLPLLENYNLLDKSGAESPYLGPVLANLRRAKTANYDPAQLVPELLNQHTLDDARNKLAVLHYRLAGWLETTRHSAPPLLAGIIEQAPNVADNVLQDALTQRAHAIELRAEYLVDQAISNNEQWLKHLGEPLLGQEHEWRKTAIAVSCFRELYSVDSETPLGRDQAAGINYSRDRKLAQGAIDRLLNQPVIEQPQTVQENGGFHYTTTTTVTPGLHQHQQVSL